MMKKTGMLFFLFCILFPLTAETEYFRSNSVGMLLEKIPWYRQDEFDFVIIREISETRDLRRLISRDEGEVKRWELLTEENRRWEKEYDRDSLSQVRVFDPSRKLMEEDFYLAGELDRKVFYFYNSRGGRDYARGYDKEGTFLFEDRYFLASDGSLREVKRVWQEGEVESSAFIIRQGRVIQETQAKGVETIISRFDGKGRLILWESLRGKIRTVRKTFIYKEDILSQLMEENFLHNSVTNYFYHSSGQVIREERRSASGEEEIEYSYDGDWTHLLRKRRTGAQGVETWNYAYSGDDLEQEEYYRLGVLESRIYYQDEGYYEELFRRGEPFIRIYYEKDKKVKEEIIRRGEVIKVRQFGGSDE